MEEKTMLIGSYLRAYPGEVVCAVQVWYEGLGGCGVPNPEEMAAMEGILGSSAGWTDAGDVRYEKYGVQKSFKRA